MMIDLQLNNLKLVERSKRIVMLAADVDYTEATKYLDLAKGHVKTAIFLALTNVSAEQAKTYLDKNEGFLKKAIKNWKEEVRS